MQRDRLVTRLIARALHRYGVNVSDLMFGDWLREKLIAAPPKKGRTREWTWKHYRIALEICRLKSQNMQIAKLIRWHLWIKGFSPPQFDPTKNRRSLRKEFVRIRKLATDKIYSTFDPRKEEQLSEYRAKAMVRSMGSQDARLKSIIPLRGPDLIDARNLIQFGVVGSSLQNVANVFVTQQLARSGYSVMPENVALAVQKATAEIVKSFGGVMGRPDEIDFSGEASILAANRSTFDAARELVRNAPSQMRAMSLANNTNGKGYRAAARSLISPDWRITNFVLFLHVFHRRGLDFSEKQLASSEDKR